MVDVCINGEDAIHRNIPLLSIVMPIYNRKETVERAINSVVNQTIPHWKLLMIDDGSVDGSVDVILPFLKDNRMKLIRHDKNRGISHVLNTALTHIDTPYFVQLDSDDWFEEWTLERLTVEIERAPQETALFYGNSKLFKDKEGKLKKIKHIDHRQFDDKYDFLQYLSFMLTPRCYRTDAVRLVGGWNIDRWFDGRVMEDRQMCLKLIDSFPVKWINEYLYNCRVHKNQLSGKENIEKRNKLREELIYFYLKKWGDEYNPVFTYSRNGYLIIDYLQKNESV
ncbi:glycosyltransferase family 2 protein [Evansella tamaricis]|uniref:Glycosyltransferase family 2 protein n=1 Tax=Evansella tamaricis TaxID=2069301 RepID=A0ABS6JI37_9BACI|nr:glycosyltransferase family A protein [Evansella tamaricis]MBU9713307.1 glycosyltransferase family 2 protein [Evansella tamaricis]